MAHFDVILIGSGHNGLVCASYLAKAGKKVGVFERRDTIGGAVCTETMFQSDKYPGGFRMDVGSSVHIMIHQTGVVEDLELTKFGLEYIELDPWASFPNPDGKGVIHFFKDLERTCESIAAISPADAKNYRAFVKYWGRINRGVLRAFTTTPTMGNIVKEMVKGQWRDGSMFAPGEHVDGLRKIFSSYGQLVNESFEHPWVKTAILWFAAQSGPTPDVSATADFAGWQAMVHESGAKHPRGGSGMLTQAMKKLIESKGGTVTSNAETSRVIVENGRAIGIRLASGEEHFAKTIVSNAHVQTTMLKLVGPEHLDPKLFTKVRNINIGNGFGMVIRCAVEELPQYTAAPDDPFIHNGMQLLCPDQAYMNRAIGDFYAGRPPAEPCVLGMTFSKVDSDVAPTGGNTLFLWAQWHPYELANGEKWDDIRIREAEKIWKVMERYAPNMKGKRIDWYVQSPLDIERKHGLLRGNVMHVEMSFDQMFMFRPVPELSRYRTPLKNLYLASASCHPGGGVFGAAGKNAAREIFKDLGIKFAW